MTPADDRQVRIWVRAIEGELLDVPWRRRRQLVADAAQHLTEIDPGSLPDDPSVYAIELRDALGIPSREPTRIDRSFLAIWPTPLSWILAGLLGVALLIGALVYFHTVERVWLHDVAFRAALKEQIAIDLPVPRVTGSRYVGAGLFVMGWLFGQAIVALFLRYWPQRRLQISIAAATVLIGISIAALWGAS